MSVKEIFAVNNIIGASASIPMPFTENDSLTDMIKILDVKNFKTTFACKSKWHDSMDALFSRIAFNGTGFAFGLTKTKVAAQFLQNAEFVDVDQSVMSDDNVTAAEVFTKENLASISSDFNYILGLIFGKLNLNSQDYQLIFKITLSKEMCTIKNLNQMVTHEFRSRFGDNSKLKGIQTEGHEKLFDQDVQSRYHLSDSVSELDNQSSCRLSCKFQLQHSGPIDFSKFITESLNRSNDLAMDMMEDINVTNH